MLSLPTGTITLLFTDIEGSTQLLHQLGDRYADVLAQHHRLLRAAFTERGGHEMQTHGDAFFVVFPRARDAILAAVAAQRAITAHPWPPGATVRVRMGIHTGEPLLAETEYAGIDVHRAARICALGHGGQIVLSQAAGLLAADLPEGTSLRDLGMHRLKDLKQPEHLFQVVHPDLPSEFPPLKSLDARPNNLPRQLTSFIGRETEIDEVKRLLTAAHLVTITGAGGVGKTRLAIQIASNLLDQYVDGVWLIELAPLSDPALAPKLVATALGVPEQASRPASATLLDYLKPKSLLLVLDNCEHLLSACAGLAQMLLRSCPGLRIIATSRERLGIHGEMAWRIPSMSVPDPVSLTRLEQISRYEAVRLFVDRAISSQRGFMVTPTNAASIVEVCARLDGMPLAIELAAARVRVLTPQQISARLDDRFRLLRGSDVAVLPHHQTLRAAMDWSYDFLSEKERALLRRLSVFAGGWSLEAAEAVCSGNGVELAEILDLLTQLVDKSLVASETQDRIARYRLLETVREYGRDRLTETEGTATVRGRHRDWYLGLAEEAELGLRGPDQIAWLERLEVEYDNLRAALEWSISEKNRGDAGLRLGGALLWFWRVRGHLNEGRRWLETMLSQSQDASLSARTKALAGIGLLAHRQGDYNDAIRMATESLALFRECGDRWGTGQALYILGAATEGQGDYERAKTLLIESLALGREVGDKWEIATRLNSLGEVARCQGDFESARASYEESLALRREIGDSRGVVVTQHNLGHVALYRRDCAGAALYFTEALGMAQQLADKVAIGENLAALGAVAAAKERYARAARLLGRAEELFGTLGFRLEPPDQAEYERSVAAARAALNNAAFMEAWAEGRAMTLEEGIEYALLEEDDEH
jgi:predicted ATPase/class 3 adenylate cyclase